MYDDVHPSAPSDHRPARLVPLRRRGVPADHGGDPDAAALLLSGRGPAALRARALFFLSPPAPGLLALPGGALRRRCGSGCRVSGRPLGAGIFLVGPGDRCARRCCSSSATTSRPFFSRSSGGGGLGGALRRTGTSRPGRWPGSRPRSISPPPWPRRSRCRSLVLLPLLPEPAGSPQHGSRGPSPPRPAARRDARLYWSLRYAVLGTLLGGYGFWRDPCQTGPRSPWHYRGKILAEIAGGRFSPAAVSVLGRSRRRSSLAVSSCEAAGPSC